MSEIREEIQEAQNLFSYSKNTDWSKNNSLDEHGNDTLNDNK